MASVTTNCKREMLELEGVNLSAEGEILLEFVNLDITRIKDKKGKLITWA